MGRTRINEAGATDAAQAAGRDETNADAEQKRTTRSGATPKCNREGHVPLFERAPIDEAGQTGALLRVRVYFFRFASFLAAAGFLPFFLLMGNRRLVS